MHAELRHFFQTQRTASDRYSLVITTCSGNHRSHARRRRRRSSSDSRYRILHARRTELSIVFYYSALTV